MLDSSYTLPIAASVAMHLLLLVVVTWGWEASAIDKQVQVPRYVEARLVQLKPKAQPVAKKPQPNKVDLVAKRRAQEQKRQLAEKRRREEQARKAAALEKAKKEKERKERQEREKQAELERQRQLEEQRLEQQRQQAQQRQLAMEAAMASELEQEQSLLLEEQYEVQAQSYVALIAARIEDNWNPPPSARRGMKRKLTLQLVPTGRVVNVSVSESSGNSAFDRSAVQAVKKVEQFPEVQQIPAPLFEQQFRTITLLFNPRDLRL